jgi:DNA-binding SARP family transcriptional activator/TolB-like protein
LIGGAGGLIYRCDSFIVFIRVLLIAKPLTAAYFLHLLGSPLIEGPAGPVTGRASYRRRVALLSLLALARGRPVGRERIIGLLWPDHPSDSARHTLSEALYVLRKDLSDELFVLTGDEVALNASALASDVEAFEAAVEGLRPEDAAASYAGPLLDGFYLADAPDFERWVEGERDRLARMYARTLEALALAAEAGGDWAKSAEWWHRLAAHDRYSSRVALRLVRALEAAGDRMAALRFAGTHAALLREELGGQPDRELMEVVARLRAEPLSVPLPPPPSEPSAPDASREPGPHTPPAAEPRPAGAGVPEVLPAAAAGADVGGEAEPENGAMVQGNAKRAGPGDGGASARRFPRRAGSRVAHAGLAAAGVAAGLMLSLLPVAGARAKASPRYDPRRIAVLYLDDYSAGRELAYLANGLTEMLIHELSQVQGLDVVSRNGVGPYRGRAVPLDSLATELRAGTVVEGSVQRAGDSVRVTVELIDTNAQVHLESESRTYALRSENLFALQDAVARDVAGFLRRRVGREVRLSDIRRRAGNPHALELVLRGESARADAALLARGTAAPDVRGAMRTLRTADSLLAEAGRLDPAWSDPTVLRGWAAIDRSRLTRGAPQVAMLDTARRWAETVLGREPGNADARELRGTALWRMVVAAPQAAHGRSWLAEAERDLRAAVAADSSRASAWATLSQLLRLSGDLAEAEIAAMRVQQADAYLEVPEIGSERLYRVALALGDYARARYWCEDGRRRFPADFRFRDCALVLLARDPSATASPDSAWRLSAAASRLDPPEAAAAAGRPYPAVFRQMMVAAVIARAGLRDSARAVSARARARVARDAGLHADFLWDDAYLAVTLGDRGRAAALLDTFVAARPEFRGYVLREPAFRGIWPH